MATHHATSVAIVIVLVVTAGPTATCENCRGPDPTRASVEAATGAFATATTTVPAGHGFGGGTVYYPTSTSGGPFGGVAIAPGFRAGQSSISWFGRRVASQGFVVITIDTNGRHDLPASRGQQLLAALDYLVSSSRVANRIDRRRLAVMGWSMGGGGALEAARRRPSLRAAIPLAAWHTTKSWTTVTVPTLVVACQRDTRAPVPKHSLRFYNSLTSARERAFVEVRNGAHRCVTSPTATVARWTISWLKEFVDGDARYTQFLCPAPGDRAVSRTASSCPISPEPRGRW